MAIVKGPALSLAASGNLGAICYSRWRDLAIARDTWTGTVPNTPLQVAQQGHLTAVAQAWGQLLTQEQRQTWVERAITVTWAGRLGDPYVPTGYQLFMKWNVRRKVMGLTILTNAPLLQEWVFVSEYRVISYPAEPAVRMWLYWEEGALVLSYGVEYWRAGPYNSGGRAPIEGEWRFMVRRVPPAYYKDSNVILNKFYWYRARAIAEYGDIQNWFFNQADLTV